MVRTDNAAGHAVSHSDRCGPTSPTAISVPSAATNTKLVALLMTKKATERRAISCAGMPAWLRTQAPSARPLMPLAGTIDPTPTSDHEIFQLSVQGIDGQNTGRNIRTYDEHDRNSNATATPSQPGSIPSSSPRTSPSPGANATTRPTTARTVAIVATRRRRCRPSRAAGRRSGRRVDVDIAATYQKYGGWQVNRRVSRGQASGAPRRPRQGI